MEERTTIARPYAEAAWQQASAEGEVDAWASAVELLAVMVQQPQVSERLHHPKFSREQLSELLLGVAAEVDGALLSGTRLNFVKVLLEANRLGYAPEIHELFHQFKAAAENSIEVEVVSAYPLDQAAEQSIVDAVTEKMGKAVQMTATVDESLFGGVVVRAGDQVIDLSLRGRLNQLAGQLQA